MAPFDPPVNLREGPARLEVLNAGADFAFGIEMSARRRNGDCLNERYPGKRLRLDFGPLKKAASTSKS
jgi:hypothetical protein